MISEDQREEVGRKVAIWIIVNVLILVCTPVLHYIYLDRLLDYEYANGIRTSTDGDIILIPVAGGFVFLVLVLIVVNLIGAICLHRRYYDKKDQKP